MLLFKIHNHPCKIGRVLRSTMVIFTMAARAPIKKEAVQGRGRRPAGAHRRRLGLPGQKTSLSIVEEVDLLAAGNEEGYVVPPANPTAISMLSSPLTQTMPHHLFFISSQTSNYKAHPAHIRKETLRTNGSRSLRPSRQNIKTITQCKGKTNVVIFHHQL